MVLESPGGTFLKNCQATGNPSPAEAPEGVTFEYGFFDFTIGGIASQGDTFLIMHLPGDAAPTTYYKYGRTPANPTDHWYEFLYDGKVGAEINGHVITLHFGDASQGDDVLIPDSQIVDLGAPGFTSTDDDGDPPEKSGGGGGCFIQGLAGTTP